VRAHVTTMLLTLVGLVAFPAAAQKDPNTSRDSAKVRAIRRFLVATKADSTFIQGLEMGLQQQSQNNPNLPPQFLPEFTARVRRDLHVFLERLVPVYDSAYTLTDLEELARFYETPLGQRLLKSQARVMQSASAIGEQWGAELAAEVMLDLIRRGVIKP